MGRGGLGPRRPLSRIKRFRALRSGSDDGVVMCKPNYPQSLDVLATPEQALNGSGETLMSARLLMQRLAIGRTKFYHDLQTGVLPQPSIRLGARSPRWLWSDVVQHLKCQQGRGGAHD